MKLFKIIFIIGSVIVFWISVRDQEKIAKVQFCYYLEYDERYMEIHRKKEAQERCGIKVQSPFDTEPVNVVFFKQRAQASLYQILIVFIYFSWGTHYILKRIFRKIGGLLGFINMI